MNDVIEYLIDGTSGIVGGGAAGCIVSGVCSKGTVGKGYLLGNRSDLNATLGVGTLVDRLKDVFAAGGQNPLVIAVPVAGATLPLPKVNKSNALSPDITLSGESKLSASVIIKIITGGELNVGTFTISTDGGVNWSKTFTIPVDGAYAIDDSGVTATFSEGGYLKNTQYSFTISAPVPALKDVMAAIEKPLELYDVEFVYIAGESDGAAWAAFQVKADELFNLHRPTYFKCEAKLPGMNEDINDWVAELIEKKGDISARFVQVCAAYGYIIGSDGTQKLSNFAGLQAGRILSIPVQRAAGRTADGSISGSTLPEKWNSTIQTTLETAGFITAKTYAGLSGVYFGDSRTLAEKTSDYQYEEVLRVVFKGLRLSRVAALGSMYDELGDPMDPADMTGAIKLQTAIETALDTMTKAIPKEMAGYQVVIPEGQDFVNNGVATELTFIGIPIIRQIKLYTNYAYAGSRYDPRINQ